jgi:uncharacterized protein YecE (DUF72 family)
VKIKVGTSGYGFKEWKGAFYPEKISAKAMLGFYAERLRAVEINYTFYHLPTPGVLTAWAAQVPDDFAFALKASQIITHRKRLHQAAEETEFFFQSLESLGEKAGPVLFQFPPFFHANPAVLAEYLPLLPAGRQCAFEFRHPSWLVPEILDLLRAHGCSLCLADTDENPVGELISTADWGYLRLRRANYSEAELGQWLARIQAQPWQSAYVFFKHEEEAQAAIGPKMAMHFQQLAGAR